MATSTALAPRRFTAGFWKRRYLVDPVFQFKTVAFFATVTLLVTTIFYFSMNRALHAIGDQGKMLGVGPDQLLVEVISQQVFLMRVVFIMVCIFTLLTIVSAGIIFSNRVAGPLWRLKRHMGRVVGGEKCEQFKARKGDFFPELYDEYNKLVNKIQS